MITFNKLSTEKPYLILKQKYEEAIKANQHMIQAVSLSSFSKDLNEVSSRFVNLKYIDDKEFIFFTNYNSPKAKEFDHHKQISALIYWSNINIQIRIKALIKRTSVDFNNDYFLRRSEKKNALAISSSQSDFIDSYDSVQIKYNKALSNDNLNECPNFWGGYSFTPYYFEFWEGHESRLNKREVYEKSDDSWKYLILQP